MRVRVRGGSKAKLGFDLFFKVVRVRVRGESKAKLGFDLFFKVAMR